MRIELEVTCGRLENLNLTDDADDGETGKTHRQNSKFKSKRDRLTQFIVRAFLAHYQNHLFRSGMLHSAPIKSLIHLSAVAGWCH